VLRDWEVKKIGEFLFLFFGVVFIFIFMGVFISFLSFFHFFSCRTFQPTNPLPAKPVNLRPPQRHHHFRHPRSPIAITSSRGERSDLEA